MASSLTMDGLERFANELPGASSVFAALVAQVWLSVIVSSQSTDCTTNLVGHIYHGPDSKPEAACTPGACYHSATTCYYIVTYSCMHR